MKAILAEATDREAQDIVIILEDEDLNRLKNDKVLDVRVREIPELPEARIRDIAIIHFTDAEMVAADRIAQKGVPIEALLGVMNEMPKKHRNLVVFAKALRQLCKTFLKMEEGHASN